MEQRPRRPLSTAARRELKAAVNLMDFYLGRYQRGINALEGLLARHWPEADKIMAVGSVSLMNLLARYGAAAEVTTQKPSSCYGVPGVIHCVRRKSSSCWTVPVQASG